MAELLQEMSGLAREAGRAILEIYGDPQCWRVQHKTDDTPLTAADLAAHAVIAAALAQSDWPLLSEEAVVPYEERRDWRRFWLVDPLDGTRDFLDRNDEFTINIALVEDGRPVAGVLYAPALDELYAGRVGGEAWLEVGSGRRDLALPRVRTGHVCAASRHHDSELSARFVEMNGWRERRSVGSALKFGRLAAGDLDVYPRFGLTSEWDTAAGEALLLASGCAMLALPGLVPLRYNTPSLRNPHFIATAPHIDPFSLEYP
ncbi:3'(2'),5'-bisphosphate nucleotidase CysQ [Chitinilyticum litopenaei]|uniref:3'(2'),5'-bisphosphate nucleotidase CysQ n=1 Tax=Chitinilyticum litopenaei TaxID=1121276 RepID=UPI0003F540B0|nr:3'(2'),5'-bisphosphate nucleotidase CysQ [Chitinilyticum litopenaei]